MSRPYIGACRFFCGRPLVEKKKLTTGGWLLVLFGLFLTPIGIGLVLLLIGFTRKERFVACPKHGRQ